MGIKNNLSEFSLGLSPMEAVTTPCFRQICKRYGADVLFSEFISSDALARGIESSCKKMNFSEQERPLAVQIFGNNETSLREAAELAEKSSCDWIDINWGCPVKKVAGKGCGSGILNDIKKMEYLTKKVVESVKIPVSVKTRLGYSDNDKPIVEIAERMQDVGVQLISIHGRTRSQMYKGEADWTLIGEVKSNPRMTIPVFGNGDIDSAEKMLEYKNRYGVDGILIGRAAMGNPFIFRQCKDILEGKTNTLFSIQERVAVCKEHLEGLKEWRGDRYAILEMRKFYSGYFKGLNNFKPYRIRLVTTDSYQEIEEILSSVEKDFDYEF
jgi:nifR3 family TIM-barrel protein